MKTKRRVILHGPSTLTISLPSKWVKKCGVKKGDELSIEEVGRELKIVFEGEKESEKKCLNVGGLKRVGKTMITSSYRQGYDEIDVNYENNGYFEIIRDLISKEMIGFEIVRQSKNDCTIKDLTGHTRDEFEMGLRRIWLLTLDLANESMNAFKKIDSTTVKNIQLMDFSINKFTNYCLRILVKKDYASLKHGPLYYYLIKSLEEIADQYKDLCLFFSENVKEASGEFINLIREINEHLNNFYEIFYKYNADKVEELFSKVKMTKNKILQSKDKMVHNLSPICSSIRDLLFVPVEMNL